MSQRGSDRFFAPFVFPMMRHIHLPTSLPPHCRRGTVNGGHWKGVHSYKRLAHMWCVTRSSLPFQPPKLSRYQKLILRRVECEKREFSFTSRQIRIRTKLPVLPDGAFCVADCSKKKKFQTALRVCVGMKSLSTAVPPSWKALFCLFLSISARRVLLGQMHSAPLFSDC